MRIRLAASPIALILLAASALAEAPQDDAALRIEACSQARPAHAGDVTYPAGFPFPRATGPVEFGDIISGIDYPPPMPTYPMAAAIDRREGACLVHFDMSAEGRAQNIAAACSHDVFIAPAQQAVANAAFPPAIMNGQPIPRPGLVYPMTFCLMR